MIDDELRERLAWMCREPGLDTLRRCRILTVRPLSADCTEHSRWAVFSHLRDAGVPNILKRSAKREAIILDSLREWPTYKHACDNAGISYPTLVRWRVDDPDFDRAVTVARDQGGHVLEDELVKRATTGGDTTALIFALKSWYRDRYGDKQSVDLGNANGAPFQIIIRRDDGS